MSKVTIHVAKTNLSKLIAKAEAGEEIVIYRGDKPAAKLAPIAHGKPGGLKGKVKTSDRLYDPWSAKDFGAGVMDDEPEWGSPGTWNGRSPRKAGLLKGAITLDDSFFDPLTDEEMGFGQELTDKKR